MTLAKVIILEKGESTTHEYDVLSVKHRENGRRKSDELECFLPMGARAREGDEIYYLEDIADLDYCDLIYNFQFSGYNDRLILGNGDISTDIINARFTNSLIGKFYGQWALAFNPNSGWTRINSAATRIDLTKQFDIYVWFTPSAVNEVDTIPVMFSRTNGTRGIEIGYNRTVSPKRPVIRVWNGSGLTTVTGTSTEIEYDKPCLLRVFRDESDVIHMQVLGVEDDTTHTESQSLQSSEAVTIGGSSLNSLDFRYSGWLHQVRAYSGAYLNDDNSDCILHSKPQPFVMKFGGKIWRSDNQTTAIKVQAQSWSNQFSDWTISKYNLKTHRNNAKTASSKTSWDGVVNAVQFTGLIPNTEISGLQLGITAAAGNVRIKVYDNSGGNPNNLLAESGSLAVSGTGLQTFNLTSNAVVPSDGIVYAAFECTSSSLGLNYTVGASGVLKTVAHAYGAGPTPFGAPTNATQEFHCALRISGATDPISGVSRTDNQYNAGQDGISILSDIVKSFDSDYRVKFNIASGDLTSGVFVADGKFSFLLDILTLYASRNYYTTAKKLIIVEGLSTDTTHEFSQDATTTRYDIRADSRNNNVLINEMTVVGNGATGYYKSISIGDILTSYRLNVPQFSNVNDLNFLALKVVTANNEVIPSYVVQIRAPLHHVRYNHLVFITNTMKNITSEETVVQSIERNYPSRLVTMWVGQRPIDYLESLQKDGKVLDGVQSSTTV